MDKWSEHEVARLAELIEVNAPAWLLQRELGGRGGRFVVG